MFEGLSCLLPEHANKSLAMMSAQNMHTCI